MAHITTPMTVSVIGCVVNGPGEARETDIGFTGGGATARTQVYIAGVPHHRLKDTDIVEHLAGLIEKKAAEIEAAKADRSRTDIAPLPSSGFRLPSPDESFKAISREQDAARAWRARPSPPTSTGALRTSSTQRAKVARLYGYREMATPIFEFTELFARGIGETT